MPERAQGTESQRGKPHQWAPELYNRTGSPRTSSCTSPGSWLEVQTPCWLTEHKNKKEEERRRRRWRWSQRRRRKRGSQIPRQTSRVRTCSLVRFPGTLCLKSVTLVKAGISTSKDVVDDENLRVQSQYNTETGNSKANYIIISNYNYIKLYKTAKNNSGVSI